MTENTIDPSDAGCWIDGHLGQYAMARLVEIAEDHGWADDDIALAHKHLASMGPSDSPELTEDEYERLTGAADDAEVYLNTLAPAGYYFGWSDGEFFLSAADESE